MDIEKLATAAIEQSVSRTKRLSAFINSGDKEPVWDGHIYIYDDEKRKKDNIKKVAVQVKGKLISGKTKETIKYSVSVIDLKGFMANGGAVFFVVYIDNETGDTQQIYYNSLSPFKIKTILQGLSKKQKTVSLKFYSFPKNEDEKVELFLSFYFKSKKQLSFVDTKTPTMEELIESGELKSLTVEYSGFKKGMFKSGFPKFKDGMDMTIYANTKGGLIPIPIEYYMDVKDVTLHSKDNVDISINGEIYYKAVDVITTSKEVTIKIGNSVKVSFPNKEEFSEKDAVTLKIKLEGSLRQRIDDLRFMIDMLDHKGFMFGNVKYPVDFPKEKLDKINAGDFGKLLAAYEKAQTALEKMNVKKDLDIDRFEESDYWKLNVLINAIEENKPVYGITNDITPIANLNIANLRLLVLAKKNEDGSHRIENFFGVNREMAVKDDSEVFHQVSQFSLMKAEDILCVDNIDLDFVFEDIKRIEPQEYHVEHANLLMLEILKAYDQQPSEELINIAVKMAEWLEHLDMYIDKDISRINKLQIVARKRELEFEEKSELFEIVGKTDSLPIKAGVFLLLQEQQEVKKVLDNMTDEEKNAFKQFPIYKFYKEAD